MNQNLVTWKIKYFCENSVFDIIRQYNSVLRFTYNRLSEARLTTSEVTAMQKTLKHCDLIGSHLKNSAIYDAKSLLNKQDCCIIFGGRRLFLKCCQQKITREEFLVKRLRPLNSIGESNRKANRLFKIIDNKTIRFNLNRTSHFILNLQSIGRNRSRDLDKLKELQDNKQIAITYKLDLDYIYLTFNYNMLKTYRYKTIANRVMAIDMNPLSVGWSIVDWHSADKYDVVRAGTFELKPLFDARENATVASNTQYHKYFKKKRSHEIIHICKQLFELCRYYHCEIFAIEDLNIKSKDRGIGRRFNKLTNNIWCRNLFVQQMTKHINSSSTELIRCQPQYSSYIGNILYRENRLPDECLSSIEIGRRGFEFATQYIFKRRQQKKTVVYPELSKLIKEKLILSLEEIGVKISELVSWKAILSAVKESGKKYRFSSSEAQKWHSEVLFSKFYKQKYLQVYEYL